MTRRGDGVRTDGGVTIDQTRDGMLGRGGPAAEGTDLSDELAAIHAASVDDETIEGEIWDVDTTEDGRIRITARLPDGSKPSRTFAKPVPWSEDFAIVRLVESYGYAPSAYESMEGDAIKLHSTASAGETPDEDDWEFVIPEREPGIVERIRAVARRHRRSALQYSVIVAWPLIGLLVSYMMWPLLGALWFIICAFSLGCFLESLEYSSEEVLDDE